MDAVYHWFSDDANQVLALFALAAALGLTSVAYFFVGESGSPTQFQFALIAAAVGVLFYVSLRSTAY